MTTKTYIRLLRLRANLLGNLPGLFKISLLKKWYKKRTGNSLHLNRVETFNEKMQWLKLFDATPIKTELVDKWLVRDYIKKTIGEKYLIPVIGSYKSFDEIDFSGFPQRFVLKANHGSGWNIIVEDKNHFDREQAKKQFDIWLNNNFTFSYGYEFQYMNVPPRIVAEEFLEDFKNDALLDYRFFCFDGKPTYVWVDEGSGTAKHKRNIYSSDWVLQDYCVNYPRIDGTLEKPETFDEMLSIAKKLSSGFAFVRVDLYSLNGRVYFGELTFTPQSGTGRWGDENQNHLYGALISLPSKSPIPKKRKPKGV